MAARLWTALLVLVGIFVMHGAQCTAAAVDGGRSSPVAHSTVLAPPGTPVHGAAETAATVVSATGIAAIGTVLTATAPAAHAATGLSAAVAAADGPLSDSHGTLGHLWSVCLAVLAAALAGLLALLLPHPVLTARRPLTRVRARSTAPTLARPPDLSELCLLRI
ncbi:DUF6153 family protein [Blastococcus saxobsidens]|uniref:Uncharacterized protein n=1 Tax=Blastococcus saxobsidens TaxID=138336 RepID=A0A4Q7Y4N5_9ACTN|nr:DUF6153 family protein [Blastococcus saxobsidens]RZU30809.1 hypothetical protein BKA19_0437 [Blastococcus saxobsidens]